MLGGGLPALPLSDWIAMFMVVLTRLSGIIFLMPGIGEAVVPIRVRLMLLLGLSMAIASSGTIGAPSLTPLASYLGILVWEALLGLCLGISLRLVVWVLSAAGAIIAQVIGLAQFVGVALQSEAQTITANLFSMTGAAILVTADFHLMVVKSLFQLYESAPAGQLPALDEIFFIRNISAGFNLAITLAWPLVVMNLIYNICLGLINRAMPQMMVAFVGAPFMVGSGLAILTIASLTILTVWFHQVPHLVGWL